MASRESLRILIFGNSGSGKSMLAARLAATEGRPHLDLDTLVWEPSQIAVQRPTEAVRGDLEAFTKAHADWIIEGCYGELVEALLPLCTELVFLDPGLEACLDHNRRRPWEPHKYASREAQDEMLEPLLAWVAEYYTRDGGWSYGEHRRIFEGFAGVKREITKS